MSFTDCFTDIHWYLKFIPSQVPKRGRIRSEEDEEKEEEREREGRAASTKLVMKRRRGNPDSRGG